MRASYEASLQSEQAKTLEDEIALADAHISELAGTLQSGERGTVWDDLQLALEVIEPGERLSEAQYRELQEIGAKGKTTSQAWREMKEWQAHKAQLVTAEAKRARDQMESVTASQMDFYRALVVRAILANVVDGRTPQEMRAGIGAELQGAAKQIGSKG